MLDVEQTLFATFAQDGLYHIQCSGLVPGPGHVYCTLIVGEEKALLIDSGFGDDVFFPYLSTLTDKPILAAATHVHPDHTAGAGAFPELWIDKGDEPMLKRVHGEQAYDEDRHLLFGATKVRFLERGQVFDLGGRTVASVYTPGHTWGSTCYYDSRTKLMLTGDTMNQRVFLQCAVPTIPLSRYRQSLCDVLKYDFDRFLGGHHPQPIPRAHFGTMLQMIDAFSPEKAVPYIRPGMEGIRKYVSGRGYGDPGYCGFMYRESELAAFWR